jgi:hypothetical protein
MPEIKKSRTIELLVRFRYACAADKEKYGHTPVF